MPINAARDTNINLLSHRKSIVEFNNALKAIETKKEEFEKLAIFYFNPDEIAQSAKYYRYRDAGLAANNLYLSLVIVSERYFKDGDTIEFKKAAHVALQIAQNSSLKDHRSFKEILTYAGLAILAILTLATAGITYVIAGGINYAINRQFFFNTTIKTDSIEKIDALENEINSITTFVW